MRYDRPYSRVRRGSFGSSRMRPSSGRDVERVEDVEQRRFATTGLTHDDDEFSGPNAAEVFEAQLKPIL
jgi:hypothetical protein